MRSVRREDGSPGCEYGDKGIRYQKGEGKETCIDLMEVGESSSRLNKVLLLNVT